MALQNSDNFIVARSNTNYKMPASQLVDFITDNTEDTYVNLDGDTMTGNLNVPSLNGGSLSGFRNAIINGNFDIWQRGTTAAVNGAYSADRWISLFSGAGTAQSISRSPFTLGQVAVPGEPIYFLRSIVTPGNVATNYNSMSQYIEDVRTFAGQTITLSFWARVTSGTRSLSTEFVQRFGTGGSPSADVTTIGPTKFTLTTTWTKFTTTVAIPSISGKLIGSNNDSSLTLTFWFSAGSSYNSRTVNLGLQSGTFEIARVQLEPGSLATPFEQRPYVLELTMCQRYFCTGVTGATFNPGPAGGTDFISATVTFPVQMRTIPILNLSGVGVSQYGFSIGQYSTPGSWSNGAPYTAEAELSY